MKVAGAEVRAWIFMPSHLAWPSGTIAIAVGMFPEDCIAGSDVCLTVGIFPDPVISPDDIDMLPVVEVMFIVVVVVAAALVSERRSLAST